MNLWATDCAIIQSSCALGLGPSDHRRIDALTVPKADATKIPRPIVRPSQVVAVCQIHEWRPPPVVNEYGIETRSETRFSCGLACVLR